MPSDVTVVIMMMITKVIIVTTSTATTAFHASCMDNIFVAKVKGL